MQCPQESVQYEKREQTLAFATTLVNSLRRTATAFQSICLCAILMLIRWFLHKLKAIIDFENTLSQFTATSLTDVLLRKAKRIGYTDKEIARCIGSTETAVREMRKEKMVLPVVKHIDTVAGEFPAKNNYLYMTYAGTEDDVKVTDKAYIVLGMRTQHSNAKSGLFMRFSATRKHNQVVPAGRDLRQR